MDTAERRAPVRSPHWSGLFLRRARVVETILVIGTLLFGIAAGVVGFGMTDHARAQGAVQYAEFKDSLRSVRDTLHQIRVDQNATNLLLDARLTAVQTEVDSSVMDFRRFLKTYQQTQLRNLCAAVKSSADICTTGLSR